MPADSVADRDPSLDAVAADLYAAPPPDFVQRRAAAVAEAKAAGDAALAAAIGGLRKPTTSAWVLNSFTRARPDDVSALLAVGERLRGALERGDAGELRAALHDRGERVGRTMRAVRGHVGELGIALGATVAGQIERTLHAAVASAEVADRLRRGVLASAVESTEPVLPTVGFAAPVRREGGADGDVDADPGGRSATPPVDLERRRRAKRRVARAEEEVQDATAALDDLTDELLDLEAERDDLRRRLADVERRVAAGRARRGEAQQRLKTARDELRAARNALRGGTTGSGEPGR